MKILLIQMLRLGDAIQMIPVIRGLKASFTNARIHALTSNVGRSIFEKESQVEKVYVLNKQDISALASRARKKDLLAAIELLQSDLEPLISQEWDWVINFSFSFPSALLSFMLDAGYRSGYVANRQRQYLSKEKWFSHSLASFANRRYSNFNWVDIDKKIIGLPSVPAHPLIDPNPGNLQKAAGYLGKKRFEGEKVIGINPGASGAYKMWPVEKFGVLSKSLIENQDCRIIIFGGEEEMGLGETIKKYAGDGAEDLTGKTSLDDLTAFLSLCDVFVSNDTGPMHLASLVGTKVVGLFFNSHFVETGPYGPGHVAVHPDIPCFPCQGPAKCTHKKCLDYISPETIEKVIIGGDMKNGSGSLVTGTPERVRVLMSEFDPWGFLEWIPIDDGSLQFQTVERLLLKVSWCDSCGVTGASGEEQAAYLRARFQRHGILDRNGFGSKLEEMVENWERFKRLIQEAGKIALELQTQLLRPHPDQTAVKDFGDGLRKVERAISVFDKDSSVSFVSELLSLYMENVEKCDLLTLSTKTVGIYRNMERMTDRIIGCARTTVDILTDAINR